MFNLETTKMSIGTVKVFSNKNGYIGVGYDPLTETIFVSFITFSMCVSDITSKINSIQGALIDYGDLMDDCIYYGEIRGTGNSNHDNYTLNRVVDQLKDYFTKTNKPAYNKLEFNFIN